MGLSPRCGSGVKLTLLLAALLMCAAPVAAETTHLAVIVGVGGEAEYSELFAKWAATLVDTATKKFGIARDRIVYLAEAADTKGAAGRSTKPEIERALDAIAAKAAGDDVVMIVLIGHGSFDGRTAKFNLPGPDMSPADFAALLKKMRARQIVFVNTASASGPFVADLAGPGRTIVTATRSGAEQFATVFGGFFIDALATDAADSDKNRRVSILEAFNAAKRQVAEAYTREAIMVTEHAMLDDNGDGKGALEPAADGADGRIASIVSLGSAADVLPETADPKLRQLYAERRELEKRVETLKLLKGGMDPARYSAEIEKALTDLALKSQEIRALEGKAK
jgi:peptidase C13-like protein